MYEAWALTISVANDPFETLGRPPAHRSVMATSPTLTLQSATPEAVAEPA